MQLSAGGLDQVKQQLRSRVNDALELHMHDNAIFLADKLVTMSKGNADDVYLLVLAFLGTAQYRRALHVLEQRGLTTADLRFRYIAAKCHIACKDYDAAIEVLDLPSDDDGDMEVGGSSSGGGGRGLGQLSGSQLSSAICLLRGRAYHALDNRSSSVRWFSEALRRDLYNSEAFDELIEKRLLTHEEEMELLTSVLGGQGGSSARPEDEWLKMIYCAKLGRYTVPRDPAAGVGSTAGGSAAAQPPSATELRVVEMAKPDSAERERCQAAFGLLGNPDMGATDAEWKFHHHDFAGALRATKELLKADAFFNGAGCLTTYICSLVELGQKTELFYYAHKLVEGDPSRALSWFAVGAYYSTIGKYDLARRHFSKATVLDSHCAAAWMGYGNAFAAQDESDQAMAAYRTAARMFPGSHYPPLAIGSEYIRTANLDLAQRHIETALTVCPYDPLAHNELGVVAYKQGRYEEAARLFETTIHALGIAPLTVGLEPTYCNLGHTYRKLRNFDGALEQYTIALTLNPGNALLYSAIGFTHQLKGDLQQAMEYYHKALAKRPEHTFTAELLQNALEEMGNQPLVLAPFQPQEGMDTS